MTKERIQEIRRAGVSMHEHTYVTIDNFGWATEPLTWGELRTLLLCAEEVEQWHERLLEVLNVSAELYAALKPFAAIEEAGWTGTVWEDGADERAVFYHVDSGREITLGDFKRAASLTKRDGCKCSW